MLDVEVADVEVGLPGAHEDDWLARGVHERESAAPTLSLIVSNLVSMMPSMTRPAFEAEYSRSDWLKPVTWSTAWLG